MKSIIVTGCSSGIGAYCAEALKRDGWRVFATVRKPEDLGPLKAKGIDTLIITGTLTNCCCESTARDALQMGYKVIFMSDANATLSDSVLTNNGSGVLPGR